MDNNNVNYDVDIQQALEDGYVPFQVGRKKGVPIPIEWIQSMNGKIIAASRTTPGGRDRVFRFCPYCDKAYDSAELRVHLGKCPKNPNRGLPKRGPKKKRRPCEWCGKNFGYSEMVIHKRKCLNRPA